MRRSPEKKAKERKALRMIVLVTQIGICMMVPIFFCVFLGQLFSNRLGQPLVFPLILLIGIMAGFRSSYQVICRFTGLSFGRKEESDCDEVDTMDSEDQ